VQAISDSLTEDKIEALARSRSRASAARRCVSTITTLPMALPSTTGCVKDQHSRIWC